MSRCFPFPPPGYAGNCSSNEALIDSIKLQRESEKAISDRKREKSKSSDKKKERKKEKKEKKREKEKAKSVIHSEKQQSSDKLYKADHFLQEPKGKSSLRSHDSEVLERSSLTEEHCRALNSQNVSCSSDSTSNSCKRKRHSSPPNNIQSQGSIIRIRLSSSHKRDEPSTSGSKGQQAGLPVQKRDDPSTSYSMVRPCTNIARTEPFIKQNDVFPKAQGLSHSASASTATLQLVPREGKDVHSLKEKKTESLPAREHPSLHDKIQSKEPSKKLSSHDKKIQKKAALYNKLFENSVPPMLESKLVVDQDDDDWLFGRKDEEKPTKRLRGSDDFQGCVDLASAALQPRAHLLFDAGIYALPFTVPF